MRVIGINGIYTVSSARYPLLYFTLITSRFCSGQIKFAWLVHLFSEGLSKCQVCCLEKSERVNLQQAR